MHTEDVSMHGNESWKVVVGGAIYIRKIHGAVCSTCLFCSLPAYPVVWATSKVGNCDDAYEARLDLINDAIWEPVDKTATGILGHR